MRLLDGGVDRFTQPEIVRGDDQPVQRANSPWELSCSALSASGAASDSNSSARIVSRSGTAEGYHYSRTLAFVASTEKRPTKLCQTAYSASSP